MLQPSVAVAAVVVVLFAGLVPPAAVLFGLSAAAVVTPTHSRYTLVNNT